MAVALALATAEYSPRAPFLRSWPHNEFKADAEMEDVGVICRCPQCGTDLDAGVECWKCHGLHTHPPSSWTDVVVSVGKWAVAALIALAVLFFLLIYPAMKPHSAAADRTNTGIRMAVSKDSTQYTKAELKSKISGMADRHIIAEFGRPYMMRSFPSEQKTFIIYKGLINDQGNTCYAMIVTSAKAPNNVFAIPTKDEYHDRQWFEKLLSQ